MRQFFVTVVFLIGFLFFLAHSSLAISYDLIAPSGQLTRGQQVQFTINIDTEGTVVTTGQIGMTYQTQYLQYVSAVPGNAMTAVSVDQQGNGNILFTGTNSAGFNGQGTFAYVTFTLIATSPGSTQLCVLWAPSATPQPTSTTSTQPTSIVPTALPQTGSTDKTNSTGIIGIIFISAAVALFFFFKRSALTRTEDNNLTHKKTKTRQKKSL